MQTEPSATRPSTQLVPWSRFPVAATGAAVVVVVLIATYLGVHSVGVQQLDPRNLTWLFDDPAQVFFGGHSYRLATDLPALSFRTDLFGYPSSISAALFDPMPVVALTIRILSGILPMPMQYVGIYLACCFVLQGIFGYALMAEIIGWNRPFATAAAALLVVMMPPFVQRTFGHTALSSHWIIVAALALYFHAARTERMPWLAFVIAVIVAAGVNVYISLMVLSIHVATAAHVAIRTGMGSRWRIAICSSVVVALNLALFNVFGYVTASDQPTLPTGDFGRFSTNLLTFFSAPPEALLLRQQAIDPVHQGEGGGYLGLGTLSLLVIAVARDPIGVGRTVRRFAPLVVVASLLFLFALLDTIRLGSLTLGVVPLPGMVGRAITLLRGNGRFVWVADYFIITVAIASLLHLVKPRTLTCILGIAAIVQAMEVVPLVNGVRSAHDRHSAEYDAASQLHFAPTVRDFIVVPPYQCGGTPGPAVPQHGMSEVTFQGFVSLLNGLRSNSQYLARTPAWTTHPWCDPDNVARLGTLKSDSVYYFSDLSYAKILAPNRAAHWCDLLYNGIICRPDSERSGESEATAQRVTKR